MQVTFTKVGGGRLCEWRAERSKRRSTAGRMGVGHRQLPHDLAQFAVEAHLALVDGFWGSIAQGATFRGTDRRRTPQGRAVVTRNRAAIDAAEVAAHEHVAAWLAGRPTPVAGQLADLHRRWLALDDGASLLLEWRPGRGEVARGHRPTVTTLRQRST